MKSIQIAIRQTLAYSDYFDFPLTFSELHTRLIGKKCTKKELRTELRKCIESKQVGYNKNYYFLSGRAMLVNLRQQRGELSRPLRIRAHRIAATLCHCPWVKAVYITGSVAVNNSKPGDDIDVMVITENNRLWTVRLLLTIYTSIKGWRRTPDSRKYAGKICLNLYLTPRAFTLPVGKRSLYTAYELIQASPLCDSHSTQPQILSANSWISSYLPNYLLPKDKFQVPEPTIPPLYEKLAYRLQLWHMRRKITHEYITPDCAFFHPTNPASHVLKKITR